MKRKILISLFILTITTLCFAFIGCTELCSFGDWETVKEATCTEDGLVERVCSVHGEKETKVIEKTAHNWSEYSVILPATCTEEGLKGRVCLNCSNSESAVIEIDANAHEYGTWETVENATCLKEGLKERVCIYCSYTDSEAIAIDANAHNYVKNPDLEIASTCSVQGKEVEVCRYCEEKRETLLPLNEHNHGENYTQRQTCCSACGGLLKESLTIDNRNKAKGEVGYDLFLEGDFEIVYKFSNQSGDVPNWHNYILEISAAEYINGKIYSLLTSGNYGQEGGYSLIPFHPGDLGSHYGNWWSSLGNSYNTTWFRDENGNDPGFDVCMARGVDATVIVKRVNNNIMVEFYMITNDGSNVEFESEAIMNFAGVERFKIRLTGENNVAIVNQINLKKGSIISETLPSDKGEELVEKEVSIVNTAKNVDGYNVSLSGDFDVAFEFSVTGNPSSDWHSFIFYLFYGATNDYSINADNLLWNIVANGLESEGFTYICSGAPDNWNWRKELTGDFATKLANCNVSYHISRRNGYISVTAGAYYGEEENPFVLWRFISTVSYTEDLTVRLTTEESSINLNSVKLMKGTLVNVEN